jgi:4-nitrophenyl phosphatase
MEACTGNRAQIIGKPSPEMFSQALKRLGTTPEETLVVGDRLETDIAGGQAGGCLTALVLSGASTENQAAEWIPAPSIIAANLEELVEQIREKPV